MSTRFIPTIWLCAVFMLTSASTLASNHLHPYTPGPLSAGDFAMPTPNPLPVEDGIQLRASTYTQVTYTRGGAACQPSGNGFSCSTTRVNVKSEIDSSKSWNSDPTDRDIMDHEKGHADESEEAARKTQAEINKKIKDGTLKGAGPTEAEAKKDLDKKIGEIIQRNQQEVSDKNKDGENDYDQDTGHGTDPQKQAAARARQTAALNSPSTDADKKKGAEAQSRTDRSIVFDTTLQRLSIGNDFINAVLGGPGYVPDPVDPVLGAQVLLPTFTLGGQTTDGVFFFMADVPTPTLRIVGKGGVLLDADLPFLLYDPTLNLFYGLTQGFESDDGASHFIDELVASMLSGDPALIGIEFRPDLDFVAATRRFDFDATSPATNFVGLRIVGTVAEPSVLWLVCAGALVLMGGQRRFRRVHMKTQSQTF